MAIPPALPFTPADLPGASPQGDRMRAGAGETGVLLPDLAHEDGEFTDSPDGPVTLAAVDLGSNSFHLVVAQVEQGRVLVIDKIKDMVRLAAGLDEHNNLSGPAMQNAIAVLARFGQRLRHIPSRNVRVVGTNTLRKARNRELFMARAEQVLGHPIEVIAGREEARLIYLGVSHSLEDNAERRLVIDIGGGSTELIVGRRFDPAVTESLYMGCVAMSNEYFADGRLRASAFDAARLAAARELEPIQESLLQHGWDTAIGASGTILAAAEVIADIDAGNPLGRAFAGGHITPASLEALEQLLVKRKHVDTLELPALSKQRAGVFPGGLAILRAIVDSLGIRMLHTSDGALREGLLYDMLGRFRHDDIRTGTVADLTRRYHIEAEHARRVRDTALQLLVAVADDWQLRLDEHQQLLRWGAKLHEIGLDIAHNQYHKHGGYLLQHMDMPGFSRSEQQRLAFLVRAHRRKFPLDLLAAFPPAQAAELCKLAVLLRVAIVLRRNRSREAPPLIQADARGNTLRLVFPRGFLSSHPLTALDLREEATYLQPTGYALQFGEEGRPLGAP
jgi:exopolyphosphatase/guanosine-5'-triphosphate,3'-diphosphate pyrophosphatase